MKKENSWQYEYADLHNLHSTNVRYVHPRSADGVIVECCTPLMMLLRQPEPIRAYKLVDADGNSPIAPGNGYSAITYTIGETVEVADADPNPLEQCSRGINVATLDWCLKEWRPGYRVLVVEFAATDIACIPTASDGKFRLHRCRVVAEKDLAAIDWPQKTKVESDAQSAVAKTAQEI